MVKTSPHSDSWSPSTGPPKPAEIQDLVLCNRKSMYDIGSTVSNGSHSLHGGGARRDAGACKFLAPSDPWRRRSGPPKSKPAARASCGGPLEAPAESDQGHDGAQTLREAATRAPLPHGRGFIGVPSPWEEGSPLPVLQPTPISGKIFESRDMRRARRWRTLVKPGME